MLVSGLVLTLEGDWARTDVVQRLAADPRLVLAEVIENRLPLVAEVPDAAAAERLVTDLEGTAGVRLVHVVMVDFSATFAEAAVPE